MRLIRTRIEFVASPFAFLFIKLDAIRMLNENRRILIVLRFRHSKFIVMNESTLFGLCCFLKFIILTSYNVQCVFYHPSM